MSGITTYEQAHLITAAVRVLRHTLGHAPTEDEIAGLLGVSREYVAVAVGDLERDGIVACVDSAFTRRVDVADHARIETLPREADAPGVADEVREFRKKREAEEKRMAEMFRRGARTKDRERKLDGMADDLKAFREKRNKPNPFFDED